MSGFFKRLFQRKGAEPTIHRPWELLGLWMNAVMTRAKVRVNQDTALSFAACYSAVRAISEDIGKVPLHIYKRLQPAGKERAFGHPLYSLLHDSPNEFQTSLEFRENLQALLLLRGEAFAFKVRSRLAESVPGEPLPAITELLPLRNDQVQVRRLRTGAFIYAVTPDNGGEVREFTSEDIWHLRGLSLDGGLSHVSPVRAHAETIGLGLAMVEHSSSTFANRARPSGVLSHPEKLSQEAQDRLKENWATLYSRGGTDEGGIAVLEEGMKWNPLTFTPEDIQLIEQRKFSRSEVASIFRIPPHKIGDLERATFTNIEQQNLDYVIDTLMPWAVRWEKSILHHLILAKRLYFPEFLFDALLRGDLKTRYEAYAVGRNWGWLSADDIRERENMNPIPDGAGAGYLQPLNMAPLGAAPVDPAETEDVVKRVMRALTEKDADGLAELTASPEFVRASRTLAGLRIV